MSLPGFVPGLPRVAQTLRAVHKIVFRQGDWFSDLAAGKIICGAVSRDPTNGTDINVLQAGLVLGKSTSVVAGPGSIASVVGLYAPSIIGPLTAPYVAGGTSLTVSPATAAEIVRRIGTTGQLTLTGPPVSGGTIQTFTVTFSAVNTSTGVITITALGASEVQTLTITGTPTGGTFALNFNNQWTTAIAFNATAATVQAALQALANVGAGNMTCAGGPLPGTAVTITFAGTLANLPPPSSALVTGLIEVDISSLTGGTPAATLLRTTAGVNGNLISGAFVGPTDGSQVPNAFISDGYGVIVTDIDNVTNLNAPFPYMPIAGVVTSTQLVNWPSDTSLQAYLRNNLSTSFGGKFVFDDLL